MENSYQSASNLYGEFERQIFWTKVISEQIASGISVPKFCKQNGLKFSTMRYWKYRSKISVSTHDYVEESNSSDDQTNRFIPIQIASSSTNAINRISNKEETIEIKFIFNNGHKMIFPLSIPEENLATIIKIVSRL